jgi:hypothetical protein
VTRYRVSEAEIGTSGVCKRVGIGKSYRDDTAVRLRR